jgi:hypothetical protein
MRNYAWLGEARQLTFSPDLLSAGREEALDPARQMRLYLYNHFFYVIENHIVGET